ncbi:MAG: TetR family transcriptional regulator C-terminal domain-containing protein [Bacteroidota bacterium]
MATIESIQKAYIDYVLTEGHQPKSVYIFAKKNKMTEEEFYHFFSSFDAIEQHLWTNFAVRTITEIKTQEVWGQYSAREKALSFFYSFFELLKSSRSFVVYSVRKQPKSFATPLTFTGIKDVFESFCNDLITEGLESNELSERKFFSNRYKDALWVQLVFVLNFWINDSSAGFEKTDEAIEKGINVTFDLFQRSPIDNLFEYGKFLAKHGRVKESMGFGSN